MINRVIHQLHHPLFLFFGHFFRLLCLRGIEVEVNVHPSLRGVSAEDNSVSRKHVCEAAYEAIAEDLLRK